MASVLTVVVGHAPGYQVDDCQHWSPTNVSENGVLLTLERSLSTGRTAVSETGPSQLLEPESGTVCRQN